MLTESEVPSLFLGKPILNYLAAGYGLKTIPHLEWIRMRVTPGTLSLDYAGAEELIMVASAICLDVETLENRLYDALERRKKWVGLQCPDCVIVHPVRFGEALIKIVNQVMN